MADINYDDIAEKIRKGVRPDTAYAPASSSGETDYDSIADKIRRGVTVTGGNSVPGMERLGGTPPAAPVPKLPDELNPEPRGTSNPILRARAAAMPPEDVANYNTDKSTPDGGLGPVIEGAGRLAAGVHSISTGRDISGDPYSRVQGARDAISGAGDILSMGLPEAIAARPLRSAISLASAMGAHRAVTATGDYLGMPPQYSGLAADAASIGVGAATHPSTYNAAGTAVEAATNALDKSTPTQKLNQGLRPSTRQVDFNQLADKAIPDINTSSRQTGMPVKDVDSFVSNTKHAKRRVWGEYAQQMGDAGEPQVDLSPMADAASNAIRRTPIMSDNPDTANSLIKSFDRYRTKVPLSRLEDELQRLNARTAMIEGQHMDVQQDILRKDPNSAGTYAAADAARDLLHNEIDNGSGSPGSRDLKQRYGALSEMERTAMRRQIIAQRQAPLNLAEQLARVRAVERGVSGAVKLATGDIIGGGRDVLSAISDPITAKYIKDWISTNGLIERAFKNNSSEAPVAPDRPSVLDPNSGAWFKPKPFVPFSETLPRSYLDPLGRNPDRLHLPVDPNTGILNPPQRQTLALPPASSRIGVSGVTVTPEMANPQSIQRHPYSGPGPARVQPKLLPPPPPGGTPTTGVVQTPPSLKSPGTNANQITVPPRPMRAVGENTLDDLSLGYLDNVKANAMPPEIKITNEPPRYNSQGQARDLSGKLGPANPAAKASAEVFKANPLEPPPSDTEQAEAIRRYGKLWDKLDEIDRDKLRRPWKYSGHYERGGVVAGNRYSSGLRG